MRAFEMDSVATICTLRFIKTGSGIQNLVGEGNDRLCGLVVRHHGYRSRGSGSIPGATRFSEKQWVWNGLHSASRVQLRSYLKEKIVAPF
jgi:hypothetical protein